MTFAQFSSLLLRECNEHGTSVPPAGHWPKCAPRQGESDGSAPFLSYWLRVSTTFFKWHSDRTSKGEGWKKRNTKLNSSGALPGPPRICHCLPIAQELLIQSIFLAQEQDQLQLNRCQHNCLACPVASLSLEIFTFQSNIFQYFTVTMVGQLIFFCFCFLPSVLFKLPVLHPKDINYCPFPLESKLSHYWGFLTSVLSFLGSCSISRSQCLLYLFSILFVWPPSTLKCGFQN